jgi:hypothetical protein
MSFHCANPGCARLLTADHVILLTTMHMRRFCCVECIAEGKRAADAAIYDKALARDGRRKR